MNDEKRKLTVYIINEYDWWADYSKEDAYKNYIEMTGAEEDNIDDVEEETRMDILKYKDEDMEESITFAEELTRRSEPGFFASTET